MFIHSVKVHRIYKTAAKIIKQVYEDGKGVKQLIFGQTHVNIQALSALVYETLKHGGILDLLIRKTSILFNEPRLDPWLARVLMTELLWGQKHKLVSDAKPIKTILSYAKKFQAILKDLSSGMPEHLQQALTTDKKLTQIYHPRYVRINTLTLTVQEAIDGFRDEGWTLVRHGSDWTYTDFLKAVLELQPEHFLLDFHVPELLVFPPDTQFHNYQCYTQGHIVLQDKASCMAAHLLSPEPGSNILDMCAAPGMKTTHLAAIIGNKGTVYAIEKDPRRYEILSEIIQATSSTCVKTINEDALKITDEQCPDVEYILVDPSCSGTGMVGRIETALPTLNETRLERLSGFQILILRKALTAFPKAKRVLYSTCSTMTKENEQVVKEVLETTKQFRLVPAKELLKKDWLSFGSKEYEEIGENCLYSKSETDYTNGFFLAVFERIAPHDERDIYIKGRKWKEIKQEPEDYDEYDNSHNNVNYSITNDNIRKKKKSEYSQEKNNIEVNDTSIAINKDNKKHKYQSEICGEYLIKKERDNNKQNAQYIKKENDKHKVDDEARNTISSEYVQHVDVNLGVMENIQSETTVIIKQEMDDSTNQNVRIKKENKKIHKNNDKNNSNNLDKNLTTMNNEPATNISEIAYLKPKKKKNKRTIEEAVLLESSEYNSSKKSKDSTIDIGSINNPTEKTKKTKKKRHLTENTEVIEDNAELKIKDAENDNTNLDTASRKKKKQKTKDFLEEHIIEDQLEEKLESHEDDKIKKKKCKKFKNELQTNLINSPEINRHKLKKDKKKNSEDCDNLETTIKMREELVTSNDLSLNETKIKKKKHKKSKQDTAELEIEHKHEDINEDHEKIRPKKRKITEDIQEKEIDESSKLKKKSKKDKKHDPDMTIDVYNDKRTDCEDNEKLKKKKQKKKKSKK